MWKDKLIFLIFPLPELTWLDTPTLNPTLTPKPRHSLSVRGNLNKRKTKKDKCRINILYTFLLSNRIWSFTICYQVTEAWLAPFVCGGLFCPVPYMEDRGGASVVGGATSTQWNNSLIICRLCHEDTATEAERLNFSSSQENGIIQYVLLLMFLLLSVWFILLIFFSYLGLIYFYFVCCMQISWVGSVSVTLCNVCHWVTVGGRYTSSLWKFKQFCRSIKNKLV